MLRRLLGLGVLLIIVAVAVYVWKGRPVGDLTLGASAREFGKEARELGAQARDKLGTVGQKIDDATVTGSVKTALGLNRNLRPYSIEVSSEHGVVTLRGRVPGEQLRRRAEAVAAEVPDVVRVLNEIQATAGGPPAPAEVGSPGENLDERALQMQVKSALSLNRELKGSDIGVQVDGRVVTLSGEVATRVQRDRALEIATETSSVASVVDRIHLPQTTGAAALVEAPSATASAERAAAAQRSLRSNPNVAGFDLAVRQEGARLVLRGHVSTLAEKDLAGMLAREGAGVPLDNLVEVSSGTPDGSGIP